MPRKREEERNQKTMHTMNEPMTVRFATEEDAPVVYRFIRKMAEYEKLEHEVDTSEEALRRSVFRERQAEVILGEVAGRPVGLGDDGRHLIACSRQGAQAGHAEIRRAQKDQAHQSSSDSASMSGPSAMST